MSSIPVRSLRLLPKSKSELDRISGNRGEIFYDNTSKSLRVFDGNMLGGTLLNASVSVTDTPPENPTQGSLWFNSATGGIYLYYQDGSSNQWIAPIVPAGLLGSGGSGSGTVLDGVAGKLAYYPSSGTTLNDLTDVSWGSNILSITGSINVSGQKNYVRFHWDTLADLNSEVSPVTWHGMLAHVHETGRVYVAHAAAWVPLANLSDVSGAGLTAFGTITVAGQSNVVAEQSNDTLTLVAGSNVTITTNATNDTITISASGGGGGGGPAFGTISVAGQSDIVAESENDVLTISAGTGISVSTVPGTDTLTITNTGITNSFITIVTPTATLIAENSTSTLTLAAGTGISITGTALTDTVTISSGFNQSLNSTDNVIFNTVTASTLQSTGIGTPTYTSGSDFIFNTGGGAGALVLNGDIEVSGSATLGNVGIANGIASLGADGKLAASQIPTSLTGAVVFKGTWNATTNTPTLADGSGTTGWQYAVSVGGTRNLGSGSVVFVAGDSVIYNGTIWQRIPASTVAEAGTLTGATLASNILSSSLTSIGTLLNLSVTNTITGSVSGNAGTVTNGVYTSGTYGDPSWLTLSKSKVGLSNVDNTTDAGKPVSTATQTALDLKAPKADPTFTGTVTLGAVGNVSITGGTTGYVLSTNGSGTLSWVAQSGGSGSSITTYPATTSLDVTANGVISYLFNNMYSGNNPTVYAISGTTIAFNLNVSGHPFLIRTSGGVNYDVGLVHVAVDGTVSTGSSAQGKVSGTLYWQITPGTTGNYRYQCSLHAGMVGVIAIQSLTSPIFTGLLTSQQSTEIYAAKTSATGTVVHDFSTGAIWSHASISANFTANFTNVPTTVNRTIVVTLLLLQGAAAYIPNAVQIDGVAQTLNWQGGSAPTGGVNKKEIVSFTLIRSEAGPAWTVLGSLTSYG